AFQAFQSLASLVGGWACRLHGLGRSLAVVRSRRFSHPLAISGTLYGLTGFLQSSTESGFSTLSKAGKS
ncbi:MAG: hypothetical protein AAF660_06375, partial [Pseudomonadota bacterium]